MLNKIENIGVTKMNCHSADPQCYHDIKISNTDNPVIFHSFFKFHFKIKDFERFEE